MSTKLLRSLTDEKEDIQKQIGCMNGIFQLFGRSTSRNHKRLPPGTCQSNHPGMEQHCTTQKSLKNIPPQFTKEKKLMTAVELSRTSCSSSCSSSTFSSADCNKTSQSEPSSSCHSNFPDLTSLVSPRIRPSSSLQLSRQSVDLRDIVKESMYKQAPGLSVKTNTKEEKPYEAIKLKDSPRPLQEHKHVQSEVNRRDVSLRVQAKLRDGPWNANEERYSVLPSAPRDSPRYSYDETESRRKLKSATKLKELPRLSLDSRERSPRISSECTRNHMSRKDEEARVPGQIITDDHEPGSNKKPSAIVARLMGFEPIPDSSSTKGQVIEVKSCLLEESKTISPSLKVCAGNRQSKGSEFPKVHCKKSVSPRFKNDSLFKDSTSASTFSVEQSPRTQKDSNQGSRRQSMNYQEASTKLPLASSSVYSEITKRLSELEFIKAGKDLRVFKQMTEAMEKTRERLESNKNEEQDPNFEPCASQSSSNDSSNKASAQWRKCNSPVSPIKGSTSPKNHGTRIVKKKPAKLIDNSVIPNYGKSCLQKIRSEESAENIKNFVERRTTREISPRNNYRRDSSGWPLPYTEEKEIAEPVKSLQHPTGFQQIGIEKLANFRKSSWNFSPRLQQQKHRMEKLSGFTTQSSDMKTFRMQSTKLPTESRSPTKRHCQKSAKLQNRRSTTTHPGNMNHGDGKSSMQSQCDIQLDVQIDRERESKITYRMKEITSPYKPKDPNKEDVTAKYVEERLIAELTAPLEQPSPVSVLDITFYEEDIPSPVKKISTAFQDNDNLNGDESEWGTVRIDSLQSSKGSKFDQRTLDDVGNLVQELGLLNEKTNHSESLTNPDHRYIAEILLSAGLLKDLGSSMTNNQINPAGLSVNPELYHVLEKDTELALEHLNEKTVRSKRRERVQRKLVFDAVSEILLEGSVDSRTVQNKMGERTMTGEKLLEKLCTKLDHQQATPNDSLYDTDDELTSILRADMMNQRGNWTGSSSQLPGLVLDLERMIFKDLISEIVSGVAIAEQVNRGLN